MASNDNTALFACHLSLSLIIVQTTKHLQQFILYDRWGHLISTCILGHVEKAYTNVGVILYRLVFQVM